MLRGQGGYKIRLELAIRTPGCPLKGSADLTYEENTQICKSVQTFIKESKRFNWIFIVTCLNINNDIVAFHKVVSNRVSVFMFISGINFQVDLWQLASIPNVFAWILYSSANLVLIFFVIHQIPENNLKVC